MLRLLLTLFVLLLPFNAMADKTETQLKAFLQSREVIDQVYFSAASAQLSVKARADLDRLASKLHSVAPQHLLRVEGYASPEGSDAKNVELSMRRAITVRNYLRDRHGMNLDIFLTGFGGESAAAKPRLERRVDIAVYQQPAAAQALFDDHGTVEKIVLK